jgi:hypothetical protein
VLTPKHVQSFRTAFNIANALFDVLDIASWRALLAAVATLDVVLASPATASGTVSTSAHGKAGQPNGSDPGRDADLAVLEAAAAQLISSTGSGQLASALLVMEVLQEISISNGIMMQVCCPLT